MKSTNIIHMTTARYPEFMARFREAVEGAGLPTTQKGMAKAFGCSDVGARHWWHGEKLPGMSSAIRISKKTGYCVEWLLTGKGPKQSVTSATARLAELIENAPKEVREKVQGFLEVSNVTPLRDEENHNLSLYNCLNKAIDELQEQGFVVGEDDIDYVIEKHRKKDKVSLDNMKEDLAKHQRKA